MLTHRCGSPVCAATSTCAGGGSTEWRWTGERNAEWNCAHPSRCWPRSCLWTGWQRDGGDSLIAWLTYWLIVKLILFSFFYAIFFLNFFFIDFVVCVCVFTFDLIQFWLCFVFLFDIFCCMCVCACAFVHVCLHAHTLHLINSLWKMLVTLPG